jgi:hypothetical protein
MVHPTLFFAAAKSAHLISPDALSGVQTLDSFGFGLLTLELKKLFVVEHFRQFFSRSLGSRDRLFQGEEYEYQNGRRVFKLTGGKALMKFRVQ